MSAKTTYTCNRCRRLSDGEEAWPSVYFDGTSRHYCDTCKAEIVLLLDSKAETSVEAARMAAVDTATAEFKPKIKELEERLAAAITAQVKLGRENVEYRERSEAIGHWIAKLAESLIVATGAAREATAQTTVDVAINDLIRDHESNKRRAQELDHALAKERSDASGMKSELNAAVKLSNTWRDLVCEVLEMLGKKARERHNARIAKIELAVTSYPSITWEHT